MKIFDTVLVAVSAIAFIGSLIGAYVLFQVCAALQTLNSQPNFAQIPGLEDSISLFSGILAIGWVWILTVIASSLYAVWAGVQRIRKKQK